MAAVLPPAEIPAPDGGSAFVRLWLGFATARVAVGTVLLLLLLGVNLIGLRQPVSPWVIAMVATYLVAALAVRLLLPGGRRGAAFDPQWVSSIGVDLVVFSALQLLQPGGLQFGALFALPILMASVLGSALLALGTAAGVALLLLAEAWVSLLQTPGENAGSHFLQAGLTGMGGFVLAVLVQQLAERLAREEAAARASLGAARLQAQVNRMVMETLTEGVLVLDGEARPLAANPAARQLLALQRGEELPAEAAQRHGWQPLAELARLTFATGDALLQELALPLEPGASPRRLLVRTRLASAPGPGEASLCLLFLQDLREMEARLRTEKLAAMGRMSTAVAHEIRNPLAAISQANALLDEDLQEPGQRQLSALVRQNVQRLSQIVEDILDVARVQHPAGGNAPQVLALDAVVAQHHADWVGQHDAGDAVRLVAAAPGVQVHFDSLHLRRVLVNLLDNARRYASGAPGSIQVATGIEDESIALLTVWSDGAALEAAVEQHLFEPFFSSESRSSGLGLFICRELCERHGASIGYRRGPAPAGGPAVGNAFFVALRTDRRPAARHPFATIAA